MTAAELKRYVEARGSSFFSRETMAFFGDTMSNYRVKERTETIKTRHGDVDVWVLCRIRPVFLGRQAEAYFCASTFRRVFKE